MTQPPRAAEGYETLERRCRGGREKDYVREKVFRGTRCSDRRPKGRSGSRKRGKRVRRRQKGKSPAGRRGILMDDRFQPTESGTRPERKQTANKGLKKKGGSTD